MPYIEKVKASRSFSQSATDTEQDFVYIVADEPFDADAATNDPIYGSFFTPNDDISLVNFIASTFPSFRTFRTIDGFDVVLFLTTYRAQELQDNIWELTLTYAIPQDQSNGSGSYVQFGFSVGNSSQHISRANSTISSAARTGSSLTPPDVQRCIGLTKNSIEGIDVPARGLRFNITNYYTPDLWDTSFLTTFNSLATCYNNALFYGFPAGEILFLGADGQGDLYRLIPIKFEFLAKPNINAVADPPFPALTMLGHDILDYLYVAETSNDFQVRTPQYRYVHREFQPGNFTLLGL